MPPSARPVVVLLSPRTSPSPPPERAAELATNSASVQRGQLLLSYLQRRRAALGDPTEVELRRVLPGGVLSDRVLVDWRQIQRRSDEELEEEISTLLDDERITLATTLGAGVRARARRLRRREMEARPSVSDERMAQRFGRLEPDDEAEAPEGGAGDEARFDFVTALSSFSPEEIRVAQQRPNPFALRAILPLPARSRPSQASQTEGARELLSNAFDRAYGGLEDLSERSLYGEERPVQYRTIRRSAPERRAPRFAPELRQVHLLYCKPSHNDDEEVLPAGFTWPGMEVERAGEGCGRLVCARAVEETGTQRSFYNPTKLLDGNFTTDVPPVHSLVGALASPRPLSSDVPPAMQDTQLRSITASCTGCRVVFLACKGCGNSLGYRVVQACGQEDCSADSMWYWSRETVLSHPRLLGGPPQKYWTPEMELPTRRKRSRNAHEDPVGDAGKMMWGALPSPRTDERDGLSSTWAEWSIPVPPPK